MSVTTRRAFLGAAASTAAGLGAGLALAPASAGTTAGGAAGTRSAPARHLHAHPGLAPGLAPGARAAGFTVSPHTYGLGGDWLGAARRADGYLGMPLAVTMQKAYYGARAARPGRGAEALGAAGCEVLACLAPGPGLTNAAQDQLAGFVRAGKAAGVKFRVILQQEITDSRRFTQVSWLAYWRHYAPVVQSEGIACAYDPAGNPHAIGRALDWFPSHPLPDEVWVDFYGSAWLHGSRLEALLAHAASLGVPAGLGEWGCAVRGNHLLSRGQWDAYCAYLASVAPSLRLGGAYYGSAHLGCRNNVVEGPRDWKIPGIRRVAAALAG